MGYVWDFVMFEKHFVRTPQVCQIAYMHKQTQAAGIT